MVVPPLVRLALIAAAAACAAVWYENGHRVSIDAPVPADIAFGDAVAACPGSDNEPYTASCLAYMGRADAPTWRERRNVAEVGAALPVSAYASQCPDNDTRPYPPACIRFMSGWFWRAN